MVDPIGAVTYPVRFLEGSAWGRTDPRIASKDIDGARRGIRLEAFKRRTRSCVPNLSNGEFEDADGMRGCPQNMFDLCRNGQGMQIR